MFMRSSQVIKPSLVYRYSMMRSKATYQGSKVKLELNFVYGYNIGTFICVYEVKDHIPRSKVKWGQVVGLVEM